MKRKMNGLEKARPHSFGRKGSRSQTENFVEEKVRVIAWIDAIVQEIYAAARLVKLRQGEVKENCDRNNKINAGSQV